MVILLTRPQQSSERFAALLSGIAPVVISPVIRIEIQAFELDLHDVEALVLTSQNAVIALKTYELPSIRAYCVGDQTARAATALGLDAISAQGTVDDLAERIARDNPSGRVVHIRGEHIAGDLKSALRGSDIILDAVVAYHQTPVELSEAATKLLSGEETVIIPVFSPRSGRLLMKQLTSEMTARRIAVCLSQSIANGLDRACFQDIQVSGEKTGMSMRDCVASCLN